jgi:hypothetical protein
MKRLPMLVAALALFAAGCDDTPTEPSANDNQVIFVANLAASSEVPPVTNAESGVSGNATITFNLTRDGSGNVTAATATFSVSLIGLTSTSAVNIAHIHEAPAGSNGSIVVNTTLASGQAPVSGGAVQFQRENLPVDAALAQRIIANPAGFYFNAHSSLNPGGVARGQLVRQ